METSSTEFEQNFSSAVELELDSQQSSTIKPTKFDVRVSIALAVPADCSTTNETSPTFPPSQNFRKSSESTKAQGYYRIEYSLIPDAPPTGLDIVVFRSAAKIYPDNQESVIALTWEENDDRVWITWEQTHSLDLDRERLLALLSHRIVMKIWDGKEYCSTRTKLDKPRLGRILSAMQSAKDETKSTRSIVERLAQNFAEKSISKPTVYSLRRKLPIELSPAPISLQKKLEQNRSVVSPMSNEISMKSEESTPFAEENFESIRPENQDKSSLKKKRRFPLKNSKMIDEKKEKGAAQILVPSQLIFSGSRTITCRIDDDAVLPKTIEDSFFSLNIEHFAELRQTLTAEFNPMTITISHVENLPSKPFSFDELRKRCEPVFCSYRLFDQEIHQTQRKEHSEDIYWNDLNLFLINLIDENLLTQFRNAPVLNIELHDRDEKITSRRVASVFGTENTDDSIYRVTGKMNVLKSKNEGEWHPHGCVRLDLSELWLGQTALEFDVPVVPCDGKQAPTGRLRNGKRVVSEKSSPIQSSDYLSNGTQMKVVVRLAEPISRSIERRTKSEENLSNPVAPFTRIVFMFPYSNNKFLTSLETSIRILNAAALDFEDQPAHRQVAALSTYKLTDAQQTSQTLNIVTGFHLFDEENHLFVLEGRKDEAIDLIFKKLPKPQGENIEILYDSSIVFSERLYVKFGVDLVHVKLSKSLRQIVAQPSIFVRDNLAKETFEALEKLHQLVNSNKLSSTTRHNLFPTVEMIGSLNRDFGVPLTEKEIKLFASDDRSPSASTSEQSPAEKQTNEQDFQTIEQSSPFIQQEVQRENHNFLQKNMEQVHSKSLRNKEIREQQEENQCFVTVGPIYPYSCQKLNATENALDQMKNYLRENFPSSSCSFNPEHQFRAFSAFSNDESPADFHKKLRSPIDFQLSKSRENLDEKSTTDWINVPGPRTSLQSNFHPKLPDPARLDELSKPLDSLFDKDSRKSSPTASSREPFCWVQRKVDFDRWSRPPALPKNISTISVKNSDSNKSSTPSPLVADEKMHFLRRSTQTELTISGRLSATQLDRLTGLLKDKPVKKGLLLPKSYARQTGTQSAPLVRQRSSTNTPDRRVHCRTATSRTTISTRKSSMNKKTSFFSIENDVQLLIDDLPKRISLFKDFKRNASGKTVVEFHSVPISSLTLNDQFHSCRVLYLLYSFVLLLGLGSELQCFGQPSQTQVDDSDIECRPSDIQVYSWAGPGLNPGECWHQGHRFADGATWGRRDLRDSPFCVCEQGKIRIFYSQHQAADTGAIQQDKSYKAESLTLLAPTHGSSPTLNDLEKWPIPDAYYPPERTFVCSNDRIGRRVRSRDGCIACKCSKNGHWLCRRPPFIFNKTNNRTNQLTKSIRNNRRSSTSFPNDFHVRIHIKTSREPMRCLNEDKPKFCILIERLLSANATNKSSRYIEISIGTSWMDSTSCTKCSCTTSGRITCDYVRQDCLRSCLVQKVRPVNVLYYFPSGSKWISPPQDKCRTCSCYHGQRKCINCDQILKINIETPSKSMDTVDREQTRTAIGQFSLNPSAVKPAKTRTCLLIVNESTHRLILSGQRSWFNGKCYYCPETGGALSFC